MKNTYLTKRERLSRALHKKSVDRLPWAPLVGPYFVSSLPLQNLHMNAIEIMRYIGNDILERHVASPNAVMRNVNIRKETGFANKGCRICYETPVGTLYETRRISGQTDFITHHMVETIEDVKIYQYIAEHTLFTDNIREFIERDNFIGDDGMSTLSGPMSPIQKLLQEICGVENTVYLMADYPDEMDALLAAMHERNLREYKVLARYPAEAVFDYEDTSSTVMSRRMYTDYSEPVINEYASILHDSGKVFITHMCGCLSAFKSEIGRGSQDGVDSLCPPDTDDLYAWDARKAWGMSKVIIGGIDPPALSRMNTAQCEAAVTEIIDKMRGEKGFILSTGDAVSFGTPVENLIAITRLAESTRGRW